MLLIFGIVLVLAFLFQGIMGFFQIKNFSRNFSEVRQQGKVLIGKNPKHFQSGTLMLMAIDEQTGRIKEARIMKGVTVFAKFQSLPQLNNQNLAVVATDHQFLQQFNRLVQQCILNAYQNFIDFKTGTLSASEFDTSVNVFTMPLFSQMHLWGQQLVTRVKKLSNLIGDEHL